MLLNEKGAIWVILKNEFYRIFSIDQLGLRCRIEHIAVGYGNLRDSDVTARHICQNSSSSRIRDHLSNERTIRAGYTESSTGNTRTGFGV